MKYVAISIIVGVLSMTACEANVSSDPECAVVRHVVESQGGDYHDRAWHFGTLTITSPEEDSCWNDQ